MMVSGGAILKKIYFSRCPIITQSSETLSDSIQFAFGRGKDAYAIAIEGELNYSLKKIS